MAWWPFGGWGGKGRGPWWARGQPWPGNGPWSFLPPWQRPGWVFGRGWCRYWLPYWYGWYAWPTPLPPYYPYYPWW